MEQLRQDITSLRTETKDGSINPERLGAILDAMADKVQEATDAGASVPPDLLERVDAIGLTANKNFDTIKTLQADKISLTNGLTTAQNAATNAKSAADTAQTTADTAKTTADDAKTIAQAAKTKAENNTTVITSLQSELAQVKATVEAGAGIDVPVAMTEEEIEQLITNTLTEESADAEDV